MIAPYYDDGTIHHGDSFDVLHDLSGIGAVVTDRIEVDERYCEIAAERCGAAPRPVDGGFDFGAAS